MANDVFDKSRAKQFAWRGAGTEEVKKLLEGSSILEDAPKSAEPEAHEKSPEELEADEEKQRENQAYAEGRCAELAQKIMRVWELGSMEAQAEQTRLLARKVQGLMFYIAAMEDHPLACVRLWRLFIRHHKKVGARIRTNVFFTLGFMSLPTHIPEVVDMLAEAAALGDSTLGFVLHGSALEVLESRKYPELSARLATLVEKGKTWDARVLSAYWLGIGYCTDAIPSLKKAITKPHAKLRATALDALLDMDALSPEELLWQLNDTVDHPLPHIRISVSREVTHYYAKVLLRAVGRLRPPEGWKALELLANHGGKAIRKERDGTDSRWALSALASGYPERALSLIDAELLSATAYKRLEAVEAAALLPLELAKPRLLSGAHDPAHRVAESAKDLYFKRFNESCPVPAHAGVPISMLKEAPTEVFESRLSVLRGSSEDARKSMLVILFKELEPLLEESSGRGWTDLSPAQRENLVLVFSCLPDLSIYPPPEGMPPNPEAWFKKLLPRFGEPIFEFWLERGRPCALHGVDFGVFHGIVSALQAKLLSERQEQRLLDLGCEAILSPDFRPSTDILRIFRHLAAPPHLLERLWELAVDTKQAHAGDWKTPYIVSDAQDALSKMQASELLDRRIAVMGAEAYEQRLLERFERIVLRIGCPRRQKDALLLAERCLRELDEAPELLEMAEKCIYPLRQAERLTMEWMLEALNHPESLKFRVASKSVGANATQAELDALIRALESPAREGASAAESARTLLWGKVLSADDPRIPGILERAPLACGATLATSLLLFEMPMESVRGLLVQALTSSNEKLARDIMEDLYVHTPDGMDELLEEVWTKGAHPSIIPALERLLDKTTEVELYWQDDWYKEEEERDTSFGFEDDDDDQLD